MGTAKIKHVKEETAPSEEEGLTERDYEDELDNREFAMFWDSLDIVKDWRNIFKVLAIRYLLILFHVHLKKHPDEI